ncbi:hypothetical protein ACFQX6_13490 [Streptosporangium lutulentum]
MNSQSTHACPARPLKKPPSAFSPVPLRKPVVRAAAAIQARSAGVANPQPRNLSRNAHRKVQPRLMRAIAQT